MLPSVTSLVSPASRASPAPRNDDVIPTVLPSMTSHSSHAPGFARHTSSCTPFAA
jgi:hypothetical protein